MYNVLYMQYICTYVCVPVQMCVGVCVCVCIHAACQIYDRRCDSVCRMSRTLCGSNVSNDSVIQAGLCHLGNKMSAHLHNFSGMASLLLWLIWCGLLVAREL